MSDNNLLFDFAKKGRIRSTSVVAYHEELQSGRITKAQKIVYAYLFEHGPKTGTELDYELRSPSAHKRLSELERRGLIVERRQRVCTITGKNVIEWDIK